MGRKPTGKPNGRPPTSVKPISVGVPEKEIILDQVLYWIDIQATAQEIAGSFHVSTVTLDAALHKHLGMGFLELQKRTSGSGKLSLRRYQFQQAKTKPNMAIWLGKQWLGQKDDPSEEFEKTNKLVQVLLDEIMQMKQQRNDDLKKALKDESEQKSISEES